MLAREIYPGWWWWKVPVGNCGGECLWVVAMESVPVGDNCFVRIIVMEKYAG